MLDPTTFWGTPLAVEVGDALRALSHYRAAIQQGALEPSTLANYGVLLWRLFEFREAEPVFRQVVEDPRTDPATLRRIAHCYFAVGRFGKSAAVMRVALSRMAKPDALTTNTLAWTLERDHQTALPCTRAQPGKRGSDRGRVMREIVVDTHAIAIGDHL